MKNLTTVIVIAVALIAVFVIANSSLEIKNRPSANTCSGACYEAYTAANGTLLEQEEARREAAAAASPAELGKALFASCQSCHGAAGEGGVGPQLNARDQAFVIEALSAYKNSQARGPQSALMFGVATALSADDINNLAAYTDSL